MSNLIRWEPAREMMTLREAMERLFDDAFTRPLSLAGNAWTVPAVDMYQTDNEVVVKAALPGIKADFENGVLTITLPKAEEAKPRTITSKTK